MAVLLRLLLLKFALGSVYGYQKLPTPMASARGPTRWLRGGEIKATQEEAKDYSKDASAIFGSMRLAALFPTGATFGAAFAMQPAISDAAHVAVFKRLYLLLGLCSLSSGLIAVIFSTAAISRLSLSPPSPATSLKELLERDFPFLWNGCNANFIFSLLGFAAMVGIRAWLSFACPVFGRIAGILILSSLSMMASALADDGSGESPFDAIPRYFGLLAQRVMRANMLTCASLMLALLSFCLTIDGTRHVLGYLAKAKTT